MRRHIARAAAAAAIAAALVFGSAISALACGGLVAPNGTISLTRTTTLAAYHNGVEHYLTSFDFSGRAGGSLGSITPLPGVPTRVIKGGDWTLQRLELEVSPPQPERFALAADAAVAGATAQVLLRTQVDALNITVLKGGATAVGDWAREHGFFLPPDAPAVLDFYAQRSPIFMATKFNQKRAAAQGITDGQSIPVHVVIPTPNPWVPLRILTLGQQPQSVVQADVFLLTDRDPAMLPQAIAPNGKSDQQGTILEKSGWASNSLMTDLRSDTRSKWIPGQPMWLSYLKIDEPAADLTNDLAIDASGYGHPDPVAAGFAFPAFPVPADGAMGGRTIVWLGMGVAVVALFARRRIGAWAVRTR
ncbi:MAG TPA: DUF2330 domain-containing protein [Actinomycetota bacterium]|nr:DUF2330 domain-containing protein [Actinomycetota bacterium]